MNSHFSIVIEHRDGESGRDADTYQDIVPQIEKILKRLLRGHTFVLLCQPKGALRLLHSVGFKSFSLHMFPHG